jgi:hypothetical protein
VIAYKSSLNDAERAQIDDYTDDLLASIEADGELREEYYADTSSGARIDLRGASHTEKVTLAVRMDVRGNITTTQYAGK